MKTPTFEQVASLIRDHHGLRDDQRIDPETQFERDLGITGDDGSELLETVERQYGIEFTGESFGLDSNEFLFHGEGLDAFPFFFQSLFKRATPEVRSFTAGQLYDAVLKELNRSAGIPHS